MKPTIFFSHSSKDKEVLIKLKEFIEDKTGGTLKIFMSSDGQSIPFGNNWMHKIEEGLKDAKIMFVFVTPKSIESGWIYFEAGYAYSKGIEVVPIGINVDIGALKPPISLLQGFNMTAEESLNNMIHIINKKFDYSFKADFEDKHYREMFIDDKDLIHKTCLDIINNVNLTIQSYNTFEGKRVEIDGEKCFFDIQDYLKLKKIPTSHTVGRVNELLISGMKISKNSGYSLSEKKIDITTDALGLINNFIILNDMIKLCYDERERQYLNIIVSGKYILEANEIKISSMLEKNSDFNLYENQIGHFCYKKYIFKLFEKDTKKLGIPEYGIGISYSVNEENAIGILELINELYIMGLIYEK